MVLVWMEPITQDTFKAKRVLVSDQPRPSKAKGRFCDFGVKWGKNRKITFSAAISSIFHWINSFYSHFKTTDHTIQPKKIVKKCWILQSVVCKVLKIRFGLVKSLQTSNFQKVGVDIYRSRAIFKTIRYSSYLAIFVQFTSEGAECRKPGFLPLTLLLCYKLNWTYAYSMYFLILGEVIEVAFCSKMTPSGCFRHCQGQKTLFLEWKVCIPGYVFSNIEVDLKTSLYYVTFDLRVGHWSGILL